MAATKRVLFGALLGAATLAQGQQPQQPPEPKQPAPRLSERQADRISERDRMIACNRQAREARLPTAQRQDFIRDCIKGDTAAAGGGAKK